MKWLYKEFLINGVTRIGEMTTVSDDTPGASTTQLSVLTDENGKEIYQLKDGEPVKVGPPPLTAKEKEEIINTKILAEYPLTEQTKILNDALDNLANGKPDLPKSYLDFKKRVEEIRKSVV